MTQRGRTLVSGGECLDGGTSVVVPSVGVDPTSLSVSLRSTRVILEERQETVREGVVYDRFPVLSVSCSVTGVFG